MIRLGIRLATAGGRAAAIGLGLTALSVAAGTAILLFALSFQPALDNRAERSAWRTNFIPADDGTLLVIPVEDMYDGQPLVRVMVAQLKPGAAIPPGIAHLPAAGQAYVSPALAALLSGVPADELRARFGTIIGTIGDDALRSPQELVAVVGSSAATLEPLGALPIASFAATPAVPPIPPIAQLMIALAIVGALAPVAVFVATSTRLSAARREQRLAALRLVGATPGQVTGLAVVEALVATLAGVLSGIALFFLSRPVVALIPLDGATWFPGTIQPPLVPAVAVLVAIPVVGSIVTAIALRRVIVTPLGVQRRHTRRPPGFRQALPLVVALVALYVTVAFVRNGSSDAVLALALPGLSFAGVIVGIVLAGPWLTVLLGRTMQRLPGGAATLLASRRLTDDPFGSFGSIAGVILAVFVASAFFTFASYARDQTFDRAGVMHPGQVFVQMPYNEGPAFADVPARIAAVPGVTGVLPVATVEILVDGSPLTAWVAPCAAVAGQFELPQASCGSARIHALGGTDLLRPGAYAVSPDRGDRAPIRLTVAAGEGAQLQVPNDNLANRLPQILIEPDTLPASAGAPSPTLFYIDTDGSAATAERVRTEVAQAVPTAIVRRTGEDYASSNVYQEFGRVVGLGLIGSLVLAGCSLAVAVTTGVLERRRQYALLRSAGMPASRLRVVVLLQAGAPLVVVAAFSAALGIGVTQVILRLAHAPVVPLPDASLALILGVSLLGALAVVTATLPPLERLTRPEAVRLE